METFDNDSTYFCFPSRRAPSMTDSLLEAHREKSRQSNYFVSIKLSSSGGGEILRGA